MTVELPHKPVDLPNWSENYVFSGFDPGAGIGFYHHLARMPYDPEIWRGAFGVVLPDGQALVYKDHRWPSCAGSRSGAGRSATTESPVSPRATRSRRVCCATARPSRCAWT